MRFPAEFIERLRSHFLVSEVVGKRIPVRRHGREYMACCPFHKEKTPSFTINDEKGFYHCFGCGVHGDAIGFVKEYEGISYPEAIERLALEAGMALPQRSAEDDARAQQARGMVEAMEATAQWFCAQLETPAAAGVRDYLASRGIGRDMIAQFRLGYAPVARDALRTHLIAKGFAETMLIEAGILVASDRGMPYSRFHDRLMFPIGDKHGKVIAFGGRILPTSTATTGMASAKYINSPDTPLFHKGYVLYNFATARKAARDAHTLVVAEGYMDVIALAQAGVAHAVAPLGTAMTEHHLRSLWQSVDEPVLCLDGDNAGQRAMWRAAELAMPLLQAGKGLRFAMLPAAHDPDSLLRAEGAAAVQNYLQAAIPLSEAIWRHQLAENPVTSAESAARLERALMAMVEKAGDATVKRHFRGYFIDQLRALQRAPQQVAQAKRTSGARGAGGAAYGQYATAASAEVQHFARADVAQKRLQRPNQQIAALFALAPQLLHHSEVEDTLHRMQLDPQGTEKGWLHALEHAAHSAPHATTQEWVAALSAEQANAMRAVAAIAHKELPKRVLEAAARHDDAMLTDAWRYVLLGWERQQLEQEKQLAQQRPAEEAYAYLLEIQKRVLQVQAEHQRLQVRLTGES